MLFQSSTVAVRRATPSDIDWIVSELREFASVYQTKKSLFPDPEHAMQVIHSLITGHVVFVAERAGQLMGFIGGMLTPHFLNPAIKTLVELFWWVAKEHRQTRAGLLLLNAFTEFGQENADWTTMCLERSSPVNEKTLTKRGYVHQDRSFLREAI
jgi:RimJ/RimL family protein N-acetyltransferase